MGVGGRRDKKVLVLWHQEEEEGNSSIPASLYHEGTTDLVGGILLEMSTNFY